MLNRYLCCLFGRGSRPRRRSVVDDFQHMTAEVQEGEAPSARRSTPAMATTTTRGAPSKKELASLLQKEQHGGTPQEAAPGATRAGTGGSAGRAAEAEQPEGTHKWPRRKPTTPRAKFLPHVAFGDTKVVTLKGIPVRTITGAALTKGGTLIWLTHETANLMSVWDTASGRCRMLIGTGTSPALEPTPSHPHFPAAPRKVATELRGPRAVAATTDGFVGVGEVGGRRVLLLTEAGTVSQGFQFKDAVVALAVSETHLAVGFEPRGTAQDQQPPCLFVLLSLVSGVLLATIQPGAMFGWKASFPLSCCFHNGVLWTGVETRGPPAGILTFDATGAPTGDKRNTSMGKFTSMGRVCTPDGRIHVVAFNERRGCVEIVSDRNLGDGASVCVRGVMPGAIMATTHAGDVLATVSDVFLQLFYV